jgi:DNA mismatch repair protein MutS2
VERPPVEAEPLEAVEPLEAMEPPQPPSRAPEPETIPDKEPEVGDWVAIDETPTVGEVTAVSSRRDRICVAIGSVQLWVARKRIKVASPPEKEPPPKVYARLPEVPFELDIRGLDAQEALQRVDRYLYDGHATGRERLGIIHGKGSGILSRHVRKHLKEHPLVASFRFGEYGEGDYGITLVELKKEEE